MNHAMTIRMNGSIRFWNRIARRYAKRPIANPARYQQKLDLTQDYLSLESEVLEFGCGTGSTALVHAPKVKRVVAIDYSQRMVDIANGKLADTDLDNVEFRCATLFELDPPDASFDAVLGLNVLHLVQDYQRSIERSHELLKPGGVFVTSTVCMSGPGLMKLVLRVGGALGLIPKIEFIAEDELEQAMIDSGFEIVDRLPTVGSGQDVFLIAKKV